MMNKFRLLNISLLILTMAFSFVSHGKEMPVIKKSFFRPLKFWTWTYYNSNSSKPYSYEKYLVEKVKGNKVTFKMFTLIPGEGGFKLHHKLVVDIRRCLWSYNQYLRRPLGWGVKLYYNNNGKWELSGTTKPDAFIEKFNCNPHYYSNHFYFETLEKSELWRGEETIMFVQRPLVSRRGFYPSSYAFERRGLEGVALKKVFNPGSAHEYRFELSDWGVEE